MLSPTRPLSYCTNVHPGMTIDEVCRGLSEFTGPLRKNVVEPVAAGLWLARNVVTEWQREESARDRLAETLAVHELTVHTLNAFPYGNFHETRVKETVYLPDWSTEDREVYTRDCAEVLAQLLGDQQSGSLSTMPLAFAEIDQTSDFEDRCIDRLIAVADFLGELAEQTGKTIRLAIEPEPCCLLQTTSETIDFFDRLRSRAAERSGSTRERVDRFVGVCYDVCHQAVEFESIAESIHSLVDHEIPIVKVHLSCAIDCEPPTRENGIREALAGYVEPRYLHQTFAINTDGTRTHRVDLTEDLIENPPPKMANANRWRIHYHVPVNAESLGPLGTTRSELREALQTIATIEETPDLEIETYTWNVLPGEQVPSLLDGLTAEFRSTRKLIEEITA